MLGRLPAVRHRPLIILLLAAIRGLLVLLRVGWLLVGLANLRLGTVSRLLTRRSPEKHLEEIVLARLGRLGRDPCVRAGAVDATARIRPRFGLLGFLGRGRFLLRRRLWQRLRRDGRQFDRRGFADLDRDGDDRRLGDRRGFFRIGVCPVAGQAGDLRRCLFGAQRCVRKVAQTVQFVGAFEGEWMRYCRISDWRSRSARTPRPVAMALDSGAREPSGGLSASTRIKMARSTPPTGRMRRIGSIACE